MAVTPRKTDAVLSAARKDLQAQLAAVRAELSRLTAEEGALTRALSGLDGDGASAPPAPSGARPAAKGAGRRRSAGKTGKRTPRRARAAPKSTADRLGELKTVLTEGPKSQTELAAALGVSPARVHQLLAELGGAVTSGPDGKGGQGKLWSLKGTANGAGAGKSPAKRSRASAKKAPRQKPAGRKAAAAK